MAQKNQGLKIPIRPAPGLPNSRLKSGNSISKTDNSDPFGLDPFENAVGRNKRQPPPRPPPPKVQSTQSRSRSIFGNIDKKNKNKQQKPAATVKPMTTSSTIAIGTLIDLQSPPCSPQLKSKTTSSRVISQVESGFEDDFSSLLSSTATTPGNDPWSSTSDFSLSPVSWEPKKQTSKFHVQTKPTIICVPNTIKGKPIRPPPPNSNSNSPVDFIKENSPPMPSVPPPPPPPEALGVLLNGPKVPPRPSVKTSEELPYCLAMYDYDSTHPEDLTFKTGEAIVLLERVSPEWLKGRLHEREGIFPESYVNIVIPLQESQLDSVVIAIFPFKAETWDDLDLNEGDIVKVLRRVDKNWLYGKSSDKKGQFPECFVQDITDLDVE